MIEKTVLKGVKHCIVVASGKGGVGKSTVAANLALTFAKKGFKTALVDADIYGPSIPKFFDIEGERPSAVLQEGKNLMSPIEKFGIKINSIGFFTEKDKAIIWRGPMASNAISQLFTETYWGDIDYMIIDFPPGTGDIQITIVQNFFIDGAIIVTTPQELSLNDARKGAEMLVNSKINVPLLGIVENMSWFTPQQHPDEKYFLFGKGGGKVLADEFSISLLAQIPLIKEVGEVTESRSDISALKDLEITSIFQRLVDELIQRIVDSHLLLPSQDSDQCFSDKNKTGICDNYEKSACKKGKAINGSCSASCKI